MSKTAAPQHGNQIYPWKLWENGEWHTTKRDKQFRGVTAEGFRRQLNVRACRRGMNVETHVDGDSVTFQFLPKPEDKDS